MAQVKDLNYFLNTYQELIQRYPNLEVHILQKFNTPGNLDIELRLENLSNQGITAYAHPDEYPDKVLQVLNELKSINRGGRKRCRQSKRRRCRQSKRRRHRRSRRY